MDKVPYKKLPLQRFITCFLIYTNIGFHKIECFQICKEIIRYILHGVINILTVMQTD